MSNVGESHIVKQTEPTTSSVLVCTCTILLILGILIVVYGIGIDDAIMRAVGCAIVFFSFIPLIFIWLFCDRSI